MTAHRIMLGSSPHADFNPGIWKQEKMFVFEMQTRIIQKSNAAQDIG